MGSLLVVKMGLVAVEAQKTQNKFKARLPQFKNNWKKKINLEVKLLIFKTLDNKNWKVMFNQVKKRIKLILIKINKIRMNY